MNNEEKILALLEQVVTDVSDLKTDVAGLKTDMSGLKTSVASLEVRMDETAALAQKTAVLLETEVAHKINLLYEGHEIIKEKLDDLADMKEQVEEQGADIVVLKDAYRLVRQELNELKKAQ